MAVAHPPSFGTRGGLGLSVSIVLGLACGPASPPANARTESIAVAPDAGVAPLVVAPAPSPPSDLARWVPGAGFGDLGDGRRGAVVGGRRILLTRKLAAEEGEKASVVDAKPVVGLGRGRRLPQPLGGGWLFVSEKHLYFGPTYDGALRLLAGDLKEGGVGIGHDLVLAHTAQGVAAYQLSSGTKVALPVANAEQLLGLKTGEVAARTVGGDVFLSAGNGKPYAKVSGASNVEMLAYDGKTFVLMSRRGEDRLALDGSVSPRAPEPGMTTTDNFFALQDPWPDMAKPPDVPPDVDHMLEPLTIAMSDRAVLRVRDKSLVVFDGKTGKIASTQTDVFAGHENCFPIRGGTPSFIGCNDPKAMTLFRVDAPDKKPAAERTFKGVYTQDFGEPPADAPLALAKKCDGSEGHGAFCVRNSDGTWTEVAPPPDPEKILASTPFLVHVAASSDGAPYGFGWEGGNGALVIVDGRGRTIRRVKKEAMPKWAAEGIRWDAVSIRDGVIRFLIHTRSGGTLALHPDGTVEAKQLEGRVAAIGERGLHVAADGSLRETLDGGISFHDIAPPPGGADVDHAGCGEAGCTVGPWHRLGWGP